LIEKQFGHPDAAGIADADDTGLRDHVTTV
jgi:hypothetical protein